MLQLTKIKQHSIQQKQNYTFSVAFYNTRELRQETRWAYSTTTRQQTLVLVRCGRQVSCQSQINNGTSSASMSQHIRPICPASAMHSSHSNHRCTLNYWPALSLPLRAVKLACLTVGLCLCYKLMHINDDSTRVLVKPWGKYPNVNTPGFTSFNFRSNFSGKYQVNKYLLWPQIYVSTNDWYESTNIFLHQHKTK